MLIQQASEKYNELELVPTDTMHYRAAPCSSMAESEEEAFLLTSDRINKFRQCSLSLQLSRTLIEFIEFGNEINSVPIPTSTSQLVPSHIVHHCTDLRSGTTGRLTKAR
jgi:hypothetical protein